MLSSCSKVDYEGNLLIPNDKRVYSSEVTVDLKSNNEEISKLIYGQFIEHLESTIYGGLWAEMIIDRKFYFPIEDYRTPWRSSGDVSTTTTDTYVGEHAILMGDEGTLSQGKLAVSEHANYDMYLYAKTISGNPIIKVSTSFNETFVKEIIPTSSYQKYNFVVPSKYTMGNAEIMINVTGGEVLIGTLSLMRDDNIYGMRKDTIEAVKKLNSPIYRWPGGNFVSGYDWEDGIGQIDQRAPKRNLAWASDETQDSVLIEQLGFNSVIESNDFGLNEFLKFCEVVGAEPYVAVNTGLGSVESAKRLVQYTNLPVGGQKNPKYIKWWAVGNEMFGDWQLGYIEPSLYPTRHNEFASAMWSVDPNINLVAVGETNGGFTEMMFKESKEYMTHISEHTYWLQQSNDIKNAYVIRDFIRHKINVIREYENKIDGLKEKKIGIVFDEYAYLNVKTPSALRDGLGIAASLHEFIRNSDIVSMANYSSTINATQGAIITNDYDAMLQGAGLIGMMYRNHFGIRPLTTTLKSEVLDVTTAIDENGRLTIAIINPSDKYYKIKVNGVDFQKYVNAYATYADNPYAINNDSTLSEIKFQEMGLVFKDSSEVVSMPYSAMIYVLEIK